MIARYQALVQRIQMEVEELERTQAAIQRHWQSARTTVGDQDAYFNSVALNLQSWYSGLERIFELIAVELDCGALGGEAWHSELLRQMTLNLADVRPPVIRKEIAERLDEYRKFRHRIRNIYATGLDAARMQPLVVELPALWAQIRQAVSAFSDFLSTLARTDQS